MGILKPLTDPMFKEQFVDVRKALEEVWLPESLRNELERLLPSYSFGPYTSYTPSEVQRPGNTAIFPNQYLKYACEMHSQASEILKYMELFNRIKGHGNGLTGSHTKIADEIRNTRTLSGEFDDDEDIQLMARFLDSNTNEFRLGAKKLFDSSGPRAPKDIFTSVVLAKTNMPNVSASAFGDLVYSLSSERVAFDRLIAYFDNRKNIRTETTNRSTSSASLYKPFLLLAGISGTGKTRFVREQAIASGSLKDTYSLVSVRPDWHEPSDMLGYVSRLRGQPQMVVTSVLKFMVRAWKLANEMGLGFDGNRTTGTLADLDRIPPYWLCLDEMNLAPVEQYFADYLSILETRHWKYEDDTFHYECDPILKPETLCECSDNDPEDTLRHALDLSGSSNDRLWKHFRANGIAIPFNLIVAGTVNMDETTHGFSRKVIDRALSLDFNEFYPNIFTDFFEPRTDNIVFTYPRHSDARIARELASTCDPSGKRTMDFLNEINEPLEGTPFQLAFRALNEMLLAVIAEQPRDDASLEAVWDDFVMGKILPRIEGDHDRLQIVRDASGDENTDVLDSLWRLLETRFKTIWGPGDTEETGTRPDLHRCLKVDASSPDNQPLLIPCRSRRKLSWMKNRLESATFTSFWP